MRNNQKNMLGIGKKVQKMCTKWVKIKNCKNKNQKNVHTNGQKSSMCAPMGKDKKCAQQWANIKKVCTNE